MIKPNRVWDCEREPTFRIGEHRWLLYAYLFSSSALSAILRCLTLARFCTERFFFGPHLAHFGEVLPAVLGRPVGMHESVDVYCSP
jgi:hypothetical protein